MTPQQNDSTMKPTIDTEIEGDIDLYRKRQKELTKRLPKRTREVQFILTQYRELQRKLLKSPNIEDPYPYKHTYIFYCMTLTEKT
jgi:hypothetical protein